MKIIAWIKENSEVIAIIMLWLWAFMLSILLFSWLFGYWYNGMTSGKFEINSCWQGFTAVGSGLVASLGTLYMAWKRYNTDSELNSISGSPPATFFASPPINSQGLTDRERG